ncbi:glycosyl hydrolase family 61-domain-containing protein [Aspergillus egyptiacus]|nr:glycosyl hydrolase family 61-domain-containing protein [Aspergillus egyptiacus]
MRFLGALTLTVLPLVAGHTTMTTLYVDGENQGDGVCIRMNRDPETATFPIMPLSNDAMACGYTGETASTRTCPVSQDSTLTFEFREYPDGSSPGSIDPSHKGPCAVYMKAVADATADNNAAGDGWFKIYEHDYDASTAQWCTEKLIANNGFLSARVPAGIRGGDYLVRVELLALHAARDDPPDPQFYVGCAQVFVQGFSGGQVPAGVRIDGGTYDLSMEGLVYDLYAPELELPYPRFGPEVYEPPATMKAMKVSGEEVVQMKGLEKKGCILVRDDWCGVEVDAYSDEEGCWASSAQCWDQADVCWNTAPPTGNKNCQIWQDKCTNIDEQCGNGNWNGPPNMGAVLTPELKGVDGSMEVFAGGRSSSSLTGSGSGSGSGSSTGSESVESVPTTNNSASDEKDDLEETGVETGLETNVNTGSDDEDYETIPEVDSSSSDYDYDDDNDDSTASWPGRGPGRGDRGRGRGGSCRARRARRTVA